MSSATGEFSVESEVSEASDLKCGQSGLRGPGGQRMAGEDAVK